MLSHFKVRNPLKRPESRSIFRERGWILGRKSPLWFKNQPNMHGAGLESSSFETRNKNKLNRSLCKGLYLGTSHSAMGKAARSSCYFSAKLFSKSELFIAREPFQVMPEYLPCAPCKNTRRVDWTCPMNYTLFIIIEPSLFPSCFRVMGWSSS